MFITKEFHYPTEETERLVLKLLTLDNVEEVYHHFSDEHITKFMDIEPCKNLKEAEEIIQFHIDDLGCRWGIYTKAENEFIGTCGFHYLRENHNLVTAEVGFDLSKKYWGKGLMREVMQSVIEFGFLKMNLDTIDGTVEPENERSLALMHRLGFIQSTELQDNLVYFYLNKEQYSNLQK